MQKVILAVATLMLTVVAGAQAEDWVYADQFMLRRDHAVTARDTVHILTTPHPSVTIGDVGDNATFCSMESAYICVDGKSFKFYVPRTLSPHVKEWTEGGSKYQIVGKDTIRIFGSEYNIFYIDTVIDNAKVRYFYSTSDGLMGFSIVTNKYQPKMYLLEGKSGFGAAIATKR